MLKGSTKPKVPREVWQDSKPTLKQVEAVMMIAQHKGDDLDFGEVYKNWTAGACSDYIGNKGDGSLYKIDSDA